MKIFVVGGGGREHAIIKKLKQSPLTGEIFCAPGNGGIALDAECFPVNATDFDGILKIAADIKPDLIVIGPDDPLCGGLADVLQNAGFKVFGPTKAAAVIEGSKVFSKALMKKYGIPTAQYETFDNFKDALAYIENIARYPAVIKADGLAAGKGVIIAPDYEQAKEALKSMFLDKTFGASGERVVIEEFLTGVELSVLTFCDGKTIKPMVSAKDHKTIFDGDKGPNTGGMGTIAPHPLYTRKLASVCEKQIYQTTLGALQAEGIDFRGVIFFGMIITKDGPKVFEYNARFGDPETQAVLPLLDGDLVRFMLAVTGGKLGQENFGVKEGAAACVVISSGGYPGKYRTGYEIGGLDTADAIICHAGTKSDNGVIKTAGGRVLGVVCMGRDLDKALKKAYAETGKISFEGAYYRKDIGVIYDDQI